jgi:hypothetical protein
MDLRADAVQRHGPCTRTGEVEASRRAPPHARVCQADSRKHPRFRGSATDDPDAGAWAPARASGWSHVLGLQALLALHDAE